MEICKCNFQIRTSFLPDKPIVKHLPVIPAKDAVLFTPVSFGKVGLIMCEILLIQECV